MLFTALVSSLKAGFFKKVLTNNSIAFCFYIVFCQGIQEYTALMYLSFDCWLNGDFLNTSIMRPEYRMFFYERLIGNYVKLK